MNTNMNVNALRLALVMSAIPLLTAPKFEKGPLSSLVGPDPQHLQTEFVHYRGRDAVHLSATPGAKGEPIAILTNSDFENGTIELDIAGAPPAGASDSARGSIGIAFHPAEPHPFRMPVSAHDAMHARTISCAEIIPLNTSRLPDFPFERTRAETPGLYESYADLEAGVWTRLRIVVSGLQAKLYINGADQPSLVVDDLKLGRVSGKVALWSGRDADGYFSNLRLY